MGKPIKLNPDQLRADCEAGLNLKQLVTKYNVSKTCMRNNLKAY